MGNNAIWPEKGRATYQQTMNLIFHDLISRTIDVYIDDVVVKFTSKGDHLGYLQCGSTTWRWTLKSVRLVSQWEIFSDFLVHQRGIEVDKNKAKAIMAAPPSKSKKEL